MSDLRDLVVGLVALNGGELVSKVRLQKTFYLVEECGLGSGLDFDYRHFGPFSAELAQAADDAVATKRLHIEERPGYHEVPYAVYMTKEEPPEKLECLRASDIRHKLEVLNRYSALELEVAATIMYLRKTGFDKDKSIEATKALKPIKATDPRVEKALRLIHDLGVK